MEFDWMCDYGQNTRSDIIKASVVVSKKISNSASNVLPKAMRDKVWCLFYKICITYWSLNMRFVFDIKL